MSKGRTIRVYPDRGDWVVKKDGAARASAVRSTKTEALDAARDIARNQGLSVIIHGRDGRIQRTVRPTDPGADDCYITTACVRYFDLTDDCEELTLLRWFRDEHLKKSKEGRLLVASYYERAPMLVERLRHCEDQADLYAEVYLRIRKACELIKAGHTERATVVYKRAVLWLNSVVKRKCP